jgi:hypothetical protein
METPTLVISGIVAGIATLMLIAHGSGSPELARPRESAAALAAQAKANAAEAKRIEVAGLIELRRHEAEDRIADAANRR